MTGLAVCEPTDLPHRHLLDSPLQCRRVSNGSPGCGREQPHCTKTRALCRVDDHRKGLEDEHPVRIRITGVFYLPNLQSAYWFGDPKPYFAFGQNTPALPRAPSYHEVDDLFVGSPAAFALPSGYVRSFTIQSGLRSGVLGIGNASAVMRDMRALERHATDRRFRGRNRSAGAALRPAPSAEPDGHDRRGRRRFSSSCWRSGCWPRRLCAAPTSGVRSCGSPACADSRSRTLLAVLIIEPAALCAIGAVLGIAGAWAVVLVAASILFTPATTVALDAGRSSASERCC